MICGWCGDKTKDMEAHRMTCPLRVEGTIEAELRTESDLDREWAIVQAKANVTDAQEELAKIRKNEE